MPDPYTPSYSTSDYSPSSHTLPRTQRTLPFIHLLRACRTILNSASGMSRLTIVCCSERYGCRIFTALSETLCLHSRRCILASPLGVVVVAKEFHPIGSKT